MLSPSFCLKNYVFITLKNKSIAGQSCCFSFANARTIYTFGLYYGVPSILSAGKNSGFGVAVIHQKYDSIESSDLLNLIFHSGFGVVISSPSDYIRRYVSLCFRADPDPGLCRATARTGPSFL
jgi:hypothetical protein